MAGCLREVRRVSVGYKGDAGPIWGQAQREVKPGTIGELRGETAIKIQDHDPFTRRIGELPDQRGGRIRHEERRFPGLRDGVWVESKISKCPPRI